MNGDEYDVADMNNAEDAKKAPAPINARETVTALVNACARWAAYWTDTRDRPRSLESIAADREMSSEGRELASAAMEVRALLAQPPADSVARLVEAGEDVVARIDFARALVDMNGQLRTADVQPAVDSALQLKSALAAHRASPDALGAGRGDSGARLAAALDEIGELEARNDRLSVTHGTVIADRDEMRARFKVIQRALMGAMPMRTFDPVQPNNEVDAVYALKIERNEARNERDSARKQRDEALRFLGERTAERDAAQADLAALRADPRLTAPVWVALGKSWPAERRCVLVQIAPSEGEAPAVGVGYMRQQSSGPYFVVPGARTGFVVTHWADCLGDEFHARPNWQMPGQPRSAPPPAAKPEASGAKAPEVCPQCRKTHPVDHECIPWHSHKTPRPTTAAEVAAMGLTFDGEDDPPAPAPLDPRAVAILETMRAFPDVINDMQNGEEAAEPIFCKTYARMAGQMLRAAEAEARKTGAA